MQVSIDIEINWGFFNVKPLFVRYLYLPEYPSHLPTGFYKSTVSRAIQSVTDSLVRKAAQFIRWPSHDEKQSIKHGLYRLGGFPNTIGCIDGTHIRIIAPATADEVSYVNRKNFHSVNVQAVCDHQDL
ncbi:hypothetical protein KUTeg_011823 [Tegillarca granosa]|uniref:DDE Tnp4 domain-containing protein n=1 Tax=Tegillarca granosa TaxID=220873 RepID=A0ABQ9F323_TEGGR|nr:hypothetical protein KUTeg_011823 [Tegillarca granosa]